MQQHVDIYAKLYMSHSIISPSKKALSNESETIQETRNSMQSRGNHLTLKVPVKGHRSLWKKWELGTLIE